MKIYTKLGDGGSTSILGGRRVQKTSNRIKAISAADDLNASVGVVVSCLDDADYQYRRHLVAIQKELFVLGAWLAGNNPEPPIIKTSRLEKEIDYWEEFLPKLTNFILPGGDKIGAQLHQCRTKARLFEIALLEFLESEKSESAIARVWVNRLSDWFFVFARYVNYQSGIPEIKWNP